MNCSELEQKILLASSGELQDEELESLQSHLAQCAQCKAYHDSIDALLIAADGSLPTGEPSAEAISRIKEAAAPRQKRVVVFPRLWVHALAYAAAVVVLISGWLMLPRDDGGRGDRISEINTIVAMMSEENVFSTNIKEGEGGNEARLRALANTLLEIQGFTESQTLDEEWLDQLTEPSPTALLEHNTLSPLWKGYV